MTIEHTPDGTPYLSNSSYLSETPPYTQELAQIIDAGGGGGVSGVKDSKFNDLQPADPVTPFPVGMFVPYMGWEIEGTYPSVKFVTTAPDGWLVCDGRSYDATYFSQLAEICASFHGDSIFRVPDMRGRAPFGFAEWAGDFIDSPTKSVFPGQRSGDWRVGEHQHVITHWADGGGDIVGIQAEGTDTDMRIAEYTPGKARYPQSALNAHTVAIDDDEYHKYPHGTSRNMPPYTGTYFIVYTGKPTLDINGDILPECGQGEPIAPVTTRMILEEQERLEEIKKMEAK